ncbi:DUF3226 domain-containing protein [Deltaproteobacteria bacterium TL4]
MKTSCIFLVEGLDDKHVLIHLIKRHFAIIEDTPHQQLILKDQNLKIQIKDLGNAETVLESVPEAVQSNADGLVGVIIDADTEEKHKKGVKNRWQSLKDRLAPLGYQFPEQPIPEGSILQSEDWATMGIWIMPNNQLPGALEDFVRFMTPADDQLWPHAEQSVKAIREVQQRFIDVDVRKAEIHTWLAWQERPGTPMGQAIHARFLDSDVAEVKPFIDWLNRLFTSPSNNETL